MEECKRMGIKVLGPDINESQNGFAVNQNGEIRFGFSGLKGVGEAAIDNIIDEKNKHGHFKDIFDLVKRVNHRAVNKKSLESLIYSGTFDCFKNMHRAQYLYQPPGEMSSLEKIVKFGSTFQSQSSVVSNSLFGDLQMPEIVPPKIPACDPFPLIEQLDYEKDVTGMYMSGHPLDNYSFELKHYYFTPVSDFNDIKNITGIPPTTKQIRLAGLVIYTQHRLTRNGKKFGVIHLEDFSGNTEIAFWSDDYVKYVNYIEKGRILMLEGAFKQRYTSVNFDFKISRLQLLESVKSSMTKQLIIEVPPVFVDEELISFFDKNIKENPGKTVLKFNIIDTLRERKLTMQLYEKGITMNDDLAAYLISNKNIDVSIQSI
jgi:DNA polymerase-3 subunit alpha